MARILVAVKRGSTVLCEPCDPTYQDIDHLASPKSTFTSSPLGRRFRSLTCNQVIADYAMHHDAKNHIHYGASLPATEVMRDLVDRHDKELCGCFVPSEIIVVNFLSFVEGEINPGLPFCQLVWADATAIANFALPCYAPPRQLCEPLRAKLERRHDAYQCACQVPWSVGRFIQGLAPDPRLQQAGAKERPFELAYA